MRPDIEKMNVWIDFDGQYEKHECDIMLKDGTIIEYCWPNGGSFNKIKRKNNEEKIKINADEVLKIRYSDYFKKQFKQN